MQDDKQATTSKTNNNNNNNNNLDALKNLETLSLDTIETLRQLNIMLDNYDPASEQNWFNQINRLCSLYHKIQQVSAHASASNNTLMLPWEAIECVDALKSPDLYLQDMQKKHIEQAQLNKGRTEAIVQLKDTLEEEVKKQLPNLPSVWNNNS